MTEEPRWPTVRDVEGGASTPERFKAVTRAIDMCRAAWLASMDDPSKSPVGEVRRNPQGSYVSIRVDRITADEGYTYPWLAVYSNGTTGGDSHDTVRGWPVIGAVPGTPAADAQP